MSNAQELQYKKLYVVLDNTPEFTQGCIVKRCKWFINSAGNPTAVLCNDNLSVGFRLKGSRTHFGYLRSDQVRGL